MFSTPATAGEKRRSREDEDVHSCCPRPCPSVHPAKRRASSQRVGAFHSLADESHGDDCQFPDDCFEKFCQDCTLDAVCPPDCVVPCPEAECTTPDACWDPHCEPKETECTDGCVDPECIKITCPEETCFCNDCNAHSPCHIAHSAPTAAGTIHCYDSAPCHFQEGLHGPNDSLAFETYPCFSPAHGYMHRDDSTTHTSGVPTPVLSHSNYTSLESTYASELSPAPGQYNFSDCFLGVSGDHCHIDDSCCHGGNRACGDFPSASQQQFDVWDSSSLTNNLMNFGFNSSNPTSPMSASPFSHSFEGAMMGFNTDNSWMYNDPSMNFQPAMMAPNKLDYLASAVQLDFLKPAPPSAGRQGSLAPQPVLDNTTSDGNLDLEQCTCRWQHSPGNLCLETFPTPGALHKHTKTVHVDNCTTCFCQWENCDASSKDFKQRSKLSRHLLGHAGYRPYACSYPSCTKTFATNQAKDNHERTHTGERPYVCDRCGYTTTTHTQLQTHISALHEGKKPHKCRFCDFTCADSSNLSKHERTHQTLRPYRCPHAGCTFKPDCRWENLKRHLRRSGHCSELLEEGSEEYTQYREGVRHEIEDWHRRNGDSAVGKAGRRKGRG